MRADPVAALCLVEIGGGHEDGNLLLAQTMEDAPEIAAAHRIDAVGRLVEEENLRGVDKGADQLQFLFHAARQIAGPAADKGPHMAEVEQFFNAGLPALAAHAVEVGIKVDIFADGEILVQAEFLAHVGEMILDPCGIPGNVKARYRGRAGVGIHDRREHPQTRRFACSVRTDKAENLAGKNCQAQALDGDHRGKGFGQPVGDDSRANLVFGWCLRHLSVPLQRPDRSMRPSAGMPGFNSLSGLARVTLMRYMSLTRSSKVCTVFGVNSAWLLM